MRLRTALVAVVVTLIAAPGHAATPDPTLLSCKFMSGRTIGGIVLFKSLRKLRIWYGDGGGEEWDNIDFSKDPITTSTTPDERSIVLSGDYSHVIYNGDDDEHSFGDCHVTPVRGKPLWWFNPILKQEGEYNRTN